MEAKIITKREVTDAVFGAVEKQAGCEARLTDTMIDLGMDSLDIVEMDMEIEKTLGCGELDPIFDDFDHSTTVEELINSICKHLGA